MRPGVGAPRFLGELIPWVPALAPRTVKRWLRDIPWVPAPRTVKRWLRDVSWVPVAGGNVRPAAAAKAVNPVGFDHVIHGRVRLGVVSALAVEESLILNELKERLETSDGNLSVHARRLKEAGYIEVTKSFEGRLPPTDYRLTVEGWKALERYLDHMEALIDRLTERPIRIRRQRPVKP